MLRTETMSTPQPQPPTTPLPPRIPVDIIDRYTQQQWAFTLFSFIQLAKAIQFGESLWSHGYWPLLSVLFFVLVDVSFCLLIIAYLRVFTEGKPLIKAIIYAIILIFIDFILLGKLHTLPHLLWSLTGLAKLFTSSSVMAIMEGRVKLQDLVNPATHILGQHTVHVLPHATARLNPHHGCFCLSSENGKVSVPLLFNNTRPKYVFDLVLVNLLAQLQNRYLQYSITEFETGDVQYFNITDKDLLKTVAPNSAAVEDEDDEWVALNARFSKDTQASLLEATQKLFALEIKSVGMVRLERVLDRDSNDVRLSRTETLVVNCPRANFFPPRPQPIHLCQGTVEPLNLRVTGMAPLELTYTRKFGVHPDPPVTVRGLMPENFKSPLLIQSIDDLALTTKNLHSYTFASRQTVEIPLNATLSDHGTYTYTLQRIKDGCGNVYDPPSDLGARLLLAHPSVGISFTGCSSSQSKSLTMGGKVDLSLRLHRVQGDRSPVNAKIRVTPDVPGTPSYERFVKIGTESSTSFTVSDSGTYEILSLEQPYGCHGIVREPSTASISLPLPFINFINWLYTVYRNAGSKTHM